MLSGIPTLFSPRFWDFPPLSGILSMLTLFSTLHLIPRHLLVWPLNTCCMVKGRPFYLLLIEVKATYVGSGSWLLNFFLGMQSDWGSMAAGDPSSNFAFHVLRSLKENSEKTLLVRLIKLAVPWLQYMGHGRLCVFKFVLAVALCHTPTVPRF